jgi:hypothetical protein
MDDLIRDSSLRLRMGGRGRSRAQELFSEALTVDQVETVFRKILDRDGDDFAGVDAVRIDVGMS